MMPRLCILYFLLLTNVGHAQNWRTVGAGLDNDIRVFYADSAANTLYAGGQFWSSGATVVSAITQWNHTTWDSLGGGTEQCSSPGCNPVLAITKYNNDLYAGGFFLGMQNVSGTSGIAKWNGVAWQSVGGCNGHVSAFVEFNGSLIAVGSFDSIGGIEAYGIAAFDGTNWFPIADTIFKNVALACCATFQNELYVGGTFHNAPLNLHCIARFNGSTWANVGNGNFTGGCGINTMQVFQNSLVVGGYISTSIGGPAEGVAQWDGSSWSDIGGGLVDTLGYPANIFDFCIHDGKLIAGGVFCFAGGVHVSHIAQWDGNVWCSFGSQFTSGIGAVESFDDTLYVGGGFWSIDGNTTYRYVAQWIGGSFVDTCGNTTEIINYPQSQLDESAYPNPANDLITFQFSGDRQSRTLVIYDALGKEVWREETQEDIILVTTHDFATGLYFYTVEVEMQRSSSGKLLVEH